MKKLKETCSHIGAKQLAEKLNEMIGIHCSYNQAQAMYDEYIETLEWAWKNENSSLSFEGWCEIHN